MSITFHGKVYFLHCHKEDVESLEGNLFQFNVLIADQILPRNESLVPEERI